MPLYHVSARGDIPVFVPRPPVGRPDMNQSVPLVWAINRECLPHYLVPRNCPRVTFRDGPAATPAQRKAFFAPDGPSHVVAVERRWLPAIAAATLYLYTFDDASFVLQDEIAGYYVSRETLTPLSVRPVSGLPACIAAQGAELRAVDNLWPLSDAVKKTGLRWSICRMAYALPREKQEESHV